MNKEIIETIKNVKTVDELKEVASKNGYNLTTEEAQGYFDLYHNNGEVNIEELDNVTGGSTCINNKHYSDDPDGWLIVTWGNSCPGFVRRPGQSKKLVGTTCYNCNFYKNKGGFADYCTIRNRWDDPYNEKIGTKKTKGPNGRYWNDTGDDWVPNN